MNMDVHGGILFLPPRLLLLFWGGEAERLLHTTVQSVILKEPSAGLLFFLFLLFIFLLSCEAPWLELTKPSNGASGGG